jgi:hypothetical protein
MSRNNLGQKGNKKYEAVSKVFFNHKVHKECTKFTKLDYCICDLCVNPLCPLWLFFCFEAISFLNTCLKTFQNFAKNNFLSLPVNKLKTLCLKEYPP